MESGNLSVQARQRCRHSEPWQAVNADNGYDNYEEETASFVSM